MIEFKQEGTTLICQPQEEAVASNVPAMRDSLIDRLDSDQSWESLVFDCSKIQTLDSIGINLVVGLLKKTKASNKTFKVVGCNEAIVKVFKLFRLNEQFTVEGK